LIDVSIFHLIAYQSSFLIAGQGSEKTRADE